MFHKIQFYSLKDTKSDTNFYNVIFLSFYGYWLFKSMHKK